MVLEVFSSYHHEDRVLAGRIKEKLEATGFTAFLAHGDIEVAAEWRAEILKHLDSCLGLVAVVTEKFAVSPWTNQEVGIAIGKGKPIVSMIFCATNKVLPGFLESLQGIAASESKIEDAVHKSTQTILGILSRRY